ncbi:MAG: glutathione S-transferase family protein [Pseudomonadota bacterium]
MALRLYWSPDSANLVVRQALELMGLEFEAVRVDRAARAQKAPGFLEKNPQGLLPVLEDGELVLFETGAILLHIAERAGRMGPDGPDWGDRQARGAFLKWLFYLSNTPHADLRAAFYTHRYVSEDAAIPLVAAGLQARFRGHLDLIEGQLPDKGGLLGPVTLLEVYLGALIRWAQIYGQRGHRLRDIGDWPKLSRLMRELEAEPAIRRAFAAEFIASEMPITRPARPDLAPESVTGQ